MPKQVFKCVSFLDGQIRLYLGNCLRVLPTLDIGSIDCIVTDPPYGIGFRSNHRLVKYAVIEGDRDCKLLQWVCGLETKHSKYIFCRWDNLPDVPKPQSLIVWVKNNWSMGDLEHEHARQTEYCLFYRGQEHDFPNERPRDVVHCARTENEYHPSEKPLALVTKIIGWTRGVVFDPFMGSGPAGLACLRTGRRYIGIEIDPVYFNTACARIRGEVEHQYPKPAEAFDYGEVISA